MLRLNNKGQSLVMFIILLPILLLILTLVYDVGNAIYEKDRLSNTNYMVVDYALDNIDSIDEDDLNTLILENDNNLDDISIMIIDNSVDLPHPEGPTIPRKSPSFISIFTFFNASISIFLVL